MEQWRVLWDDPNCSSHAFEGDVINWLPVDEYSTRVGSVESIEESKDGGLPTSRGTDDGYFLSGRDGEGDIFENKTVRVVSEVDLVESDGTAPQNEVAGSCFVLR